MKLVVLATIYGRTTTDDGTWYENRRWDVVEVGGDRPRWEVRTSECPAPAANWGEVERRTFEGVPAAEAMAYAMDRAGWLVGVTEAGEPEVGMFYPGD